MLQRQSLKEPHIFGKAGAVLCRSSGSGFTLPASIPTLVIIMGWLKNKRAVYNYFPIHISAYNKLKSFSISLKNSINKNVIFGYLMNDWLYCTVGYP
jgi:hypothetical protein